MFNTVDYIKKSIREFVALAFWILLFIFVAIFVKYYRNIEDLTTFIIKFAGPLAILVYGAARSSVKNIKIDRKLKNEGQAEGEFTVRLTYMDLLRHELTAFVVALVILITPYFFVTNYSWAYIFAAFFAFIAIWWLKMFYFKKS